MALTIDQLNIQISANSEQAIADLDRLISKLDQLQAVSTGFGKAGRATTSALGNISKSARKSAKGIDTYAASAKRGSVNTLSFTDRLTRNIAKWTILIGAVKKAASVMADWFNESNDYIETLNLFNITMGEASAEAYAYAEQVQKLIGIDVAEWMQYQGTFKQLTSGFGVAEEAANTMSKNLTQLSYDLGSFFNKDTEVAFDKLSSAMAGQVKGLREFGIDTTVASLQEYALSKGIEKTVRSMTQAEKAVLRYNYIMEKSINIQGDMARTLITPANSLRILSAQFTQLKRALGNIISVLVTQFIPYIQVAVEWLTNAANAVARFFGFKIDDFVADVSGLQTGGFADDMEDGEDALEGAADSAKEIRKQLMGFDELNVLSNPDSGAGAEGEGGGALDMDLYEYDFLKNLDTSKIDAIKQQFKDIGKAAEDLVNLLSDSLGLDGVWTSIQKGIEQVDFEAITKSAKDIFAQLQPIAKSALNGLTVVAQSLFGFIGSVIGGFIPLGGKVIEITLDSIDRFFSKEGASLARWIGEMSNDLAFGAEQAGLAVQNIFGALTGALDVNKENLSLSLYQILWAVEEIVLSVITIVSGLFSGLMEGFNLFVEEERPLIDEFLGGAVETITLFADTVSGIIGGIFESVRKWWETDGKGVWDGIVEVFFDLTAIILEFWNDTVKPVIDHLATTLTTLWDRHLQPLWNNILDFITSVWDFLKALWDGILKPLVDFVVKLLGPPIMATIDSIIDVVGTVIEIIVDVVSGIFKALGGLLDFITGIFTGNWKKAWEGIKTFFKGIWDAIWGVVRGVVNLIIDGLNSLWRGLYSALAGIINGVGGLIKDIGELFGADWGWEIPAYPPLIPRLYAGGGFPEMGEMFIAREAGPELVGSIGKKTAVANNDQIIAGIEAGVYRAMTAANSSGGTQTIRIINEIDGDVVGEKVIQYHNGKVMQTGVSPLLV